MSPLQNDWVDLNPQLIDNSRDDYQGLKADENTETCRGCYVKIHNILTHVKKSKRCGEYYFSHELHKKDLIVNIDDQMKTYCDKNLQVL